MSADRLRPETRFLFDCLRDALGPSRVRSSGIVVPGTIDWHRFERLAWDHGVSPLVFWQLNAAAESGVNLPRQTLESLRLTTAAIAAVNLRLTAELLTVSAHLESAGIPMIAYKGPLLAWRGYGDLALRHFSDLDVLVRPEHVDHAISVLRACGYVARGSDSEIRRVRKWAHHISLMRTDVGSLLELHWRFHKPMFGPPVLEAGAWLNAREESIADRPLRTLAVRDELLLIATHGSWHGWSQLSWICDVAALSTARTDWSAEELLEAARTARIMRPLLLGFELTRLILRNPVPPLLESAIARDIAVRRAARGVLNRIDSGRGPDIRSAALQLAVRHRIRDKLAFALRAAFVPNPSDVSVIRLSESLSPLYYLLRPVRIALKYRPRR